MTDAAIIQATFSEWRMVKGRKVLQIICEVPLEAQGRVFAALGAPMPDTDTWVAIARLRDQQTASEPEQIAAPQDDAPKPPARLSQIAGIIAGEGAFTTFMRDVHGYDCEPAEATRLFCGINSRRELDDTANSSARANFMALKSDYEAWLKCEDAA
jgi:hypothetical protein